MAGDRLEDKSAVEFETLLAPIIDVAYGTAYRLTRNRDEAEDLFQEATLQAFRAFKTFAPGTNFKAWVLKILMNRFLNRCRKHRREPETAPLSDVSELYLYLQTKRAGLHRIGNNPSEIVINKMTEEQIEMAINALPQEYRATAVLYFMEEISYQEIAEILDCPIGTVRSRLHRGRKLLQKALWNLAESQQTISEQTEESRSRT
jgi:RNA polymerase sigma-70 factor (ECF subfamily)